MRWFNNRTSEISETKDWWEYLDQIIHEDWWEYLDQITLEGSVRVTK